MQKILIRLKVVLNYLGMALIVKINFLGKFATKNESLKYTCVHQESSLSFSL